MKKLLHKCLLIASIAMVSSGYSQKFDFGQGKPAKGFVAVHTDQLYNESQGYGFEFSRDLQYGRQKIKDALFDDYITSSSPFYFSVKLPEGNYRLTVHYAAGSKSTIKVECRRLMEELLITKSNATRSYVVHVKDSMIRTTNSKVKLKPREFEYLHWDNKLTIEFNNSASKICGVEVEKVEVPTIFLAGNSTVVDQAHEPWAAWGQMFPSFLKPGIAVGNYAESGETLKSFKGARRLEKIWSMAKAGDYLFIEFAHNDQKPGANHLDPFTTYKQTLKEWIAEARKRGVIPVLVTSMHRRQFDSTGHIINTLLDYPEAVRQTGIEENVPVIDLNAMSKTLYEAWGPERSIKAFVHFPANSFPNQPKELKDNTHFSTYGAWHLARCIISVLKTNIPALGQYIKKDIQYFQPSNPLPFENWSLPASSFVGAVKPDGN